MALHSPISAYLDLADGLVHGRYAENDLPTHTAALPPLTRDLLDQLNQNAEQYVYAHPRRGWNILAVAAAAAAHLDSELQTTTFLQGLAAWRLARMANAWVDPPRAQTAVAQARRAFEQLADAGWLAACAWQVNALPWTRPDYQQAALELARALSVMQATAALALYVPDCLLSLAYAYLLTGQRDAAAQATDAGLAIFAARDDVIGQARGHLTHASRLRRLNDYGAAHDHLQRARALLQARNAPLLQAQIDYQLGFYHFFTRAHYTKALDTFARAVANFADAEIPVWAAMCQVGEAMVNQNLGRLQAAFALLEKATPVFRAYQIDGMHADALCDLGEIHMRRGTYATARDCFQTAKTLYTRINMPLMLNYAEMRLGATYMETGQYQRALRQLETAEKQFQALGNRENQIICQVYQGQIWSTLNHPKRALACLEAAFRYYESIGQPDWMAALYRHRARVHLDQGQPERAAALLQSALELPPERQGAAVRAALHLILAIVLIDLKQFDAARTHLQSAAERFTALQNPIEQAACWLAWGELSTRMADRARAQSAWRQALNLNAHASPELDWQIHARLAQLADGTADPTTALQHYEEAATAVKQVRQRLWQPELAGVYSLRVADIFDRAIPLAARQNAPGQVARFIAIAKAHTLSRQPAPLRAAADLPDELHNLAGDIRWLQEQLNTLPAGGQTNRAVRQELTPRYLESVRQYNIAMERLERARTPAPAVEAAATQAELSPLREAAAARLGARWLALDYYATEDQVVISASTPADHRIFTVNLSPRQRLALRACSRGGPGVVWSPADLATLGDLLIPPAIAAQLSPDCVLILAPHRQLHQLPWAGLRVGTPARPLVAACTPLITPALDSLLHLWQRPRIVADGYAHGLLVGLAEFDGRYPALPEVEQEAALLAQQWGGALTALRGPAAATHALQALRQGSEWETFDFMHIASHGLVDQVTGRLGGWAFHDRDFWLDELRDLHPLPRLVALSACSGLRSHLHAGQEPFGPALACLAAGAQTVIGSLWRIQDTATPRFMLDFYTALRQENGPAAALALAQRAAWRRNEPATHWASFQCVGEP